ncbi:Hint domain-containing protein [Roseicyclus mahoneyensis]|uniref:Hint domain-containing protein n=1 Tax=Roseicyclus mahoneyensis TaxID=164332 RepID=A0A316GKB7_9RHOB|nr:Hint domain-containing protein [Roseicyclus mahoneyensis]PWK60428.1 Hint domain-containing protein [Roseicyclus mahoneyensis]
MIPVLRHDFPIATERRQVLPAALPFACGLAAGTRVETADGLVAVEDLVPGQLLETTEGHQPLLRLLRCLPGSPSATSQVMLPAGILGRGKPLILAAEQEIVVSGWIAELHFGADAVTLTPAMLLRQGLARVVGPAQETSLYMPVVARPSAVYAGALALTIACVGGETAQDHDAALPGTIELNDAEAALVLSLLGAATLH